MNARHQRLGAVLDPVLDEVKSQYDVGQWSDAQWVGNGYRIAAEVGEYFVSVSPAGRSDASLRFEVMLLCHLEDKAFPAPRLVRTRAGRPWFRSGAGSPVLVCEWVTAGAVDADLAQHRRRSVRVLAEYHAAVRSFPPRLRVDGGPTLHALEQQAPTALEALVGVSGWYLDADGRQCLRSAASYVWRQYFRLPELLHAGGATLPRLVIHGDFRSSAVILDGGPDGTPGDGLAGFARARYDLRALDLAAALKAFARAPGGFDLERCAELVAAYGETDPLSPGEVEALPGILRLERLRRVFRLASRLEEGSPESVRELVHVVNNEARHLRWLEEHEGALIDALGSALVP